MVEMNPLKAISSHFSRRLGPHSLKQTPRKGDASTVVTWKEETCKSSLWKAFGLSDEDLKGSSLVLQRDVPSDVMEAIHTVANKTQHGFVETWLPDLLEKDVRPVVDNKEQEKLVDRILDYRDHAIKLIPSKENKELLESSNVRERLDLIRRHYASSQLQFHVYEQRTEGAKDIFKVAILAAAAGFFLSAFAPAFVQTAEALGDDVANWFAQLYAMRGSGLSKKEIAKSQIFPVASVVGVQRLTEGMNTALQGGTAGAVSLGAKYGLAASLVSLAGIPSSIYLLARNYMALVKEGKVDPPPYQGRWKKVRLFFHAIKESAKQCWKNPAVPGIVLGSVAAIAVSALLGPLSLPLMSGVLLQNPAFLAVAGTGASLGALLSTTFHKKIWARKFKKVLEKIATTTICTEPCK